MSGPWTQERVDWLREYYPKEGKLWCAKRLAMTEGQIRSKASRLGLKARGVSKAWRRKQTEHAEILRGRKRPAQAAVMKGLHRAGKLIKTPLQREAAATRMKQWYATHEHPRGALGMRHSATTKRIISRKSRQAWASYGPEKQAEITMKILRTKAAKGNSVNPRPKASWKAGWREIGGIRKYYRSKWEANYARYLEWLRASGNIRSWQHEPTTFWFEKIKRGCRSYLPDFCVIEKDGREVYHEVKGWMDDRSKTKLKRMAKYHPSVALYVVKAKQYKEIKAKLSSCIPGWEP